MLNNRAEIAILTLNYLKKKQWATLKLEKIIKNKKKLNIKSKNDLLININRYFDDKIKQSSKNIERSSPKDMVFEVLMMRFDILNEHRSSIINIYNFLKTNPTTFVYLIPSFIESIIAMSKIAELNILGLKGRVKINGLLIIYFSAFLIWLNDKSSSLDKTMTNLDNNLLKAEKIMNIIN